MQSTTQPTTRTPTTHTERLLAFFQENPDQEFSITELGKALNTSNSIASATASLLRQQTALPGGQRDTSPIKVPRIGRFIYVTDPWRQGTPPQADHDGTTSPASSEKLTLEIVRKSASGRILAVDIDTDKMYVLKEVDL